MARGTRRPRYYETQGKFVERNYPYGDQARFRKALPSLEDIFRAGGEDTTNSFNKLVRLKASPGELYDLLRAIGVSSDEPIQWTRTERRTAGQLSNKCEKLAVEIEHAREKWPFGASMVYSDFMKWEELPELLRSYAKAWKKELAHPFRSARSPRNENIVRLVRYVKDKTGDYRYQQVADLLNATDGAYGWKTRDENLRWSPDNLRWIEFRAKKKSE
jgi:hypothetical protein